MQVELREHWGRNIATGKPEKIRQYRIFVDGRAVGFLSWKPGASPQLVERFGPIELAEIEEAIAGLVPTKPGAAKQAPDVPPELLERQTEPEDEFDDLEI